MADLVILNGKVITFAGPDAEALAIKDGHITAVGSTAEIRAIAGQAQVIDAQGNTVLPGFIDSHVHLFQGSAELDYLDLYDVKGIEQLTAAVRPYQGSVISTLFVTNTRASLFSRSKTDRLPPLLLKWTLQG